MTGAQLHAARQRLGLSCSELGEACRLAGSPKSAGDRIRDMELGRRDISGPVAAVVEALLSGWRPAPRTDWFEVAKDIVSR